MYSKVVPTLHTDIANAVRDETHIPEQQGMPPRSVIIAPLDDIDVTSSRPLSPLTSWRIEEPSRRSGDTTAAITATPGLGLGLGNTEGARAFATGPAPATTRTLRDEPSSRLLDDDDQWGSDAKIERNITGGGGQQRALSGIARGGHPPGESAAEPPRLAGAPVFGASIPGDDANGGGGAGAGEQDEEWGLHNTTEGSEAPGCLRHRVVSYAEENHLDVSAETNSLSKVR